MAMGTKAQKAQGFALGVGVLAAIFTIAGLASPWWSMSEPAEADLTLWGSTTKVGDQETSTSWDDVCPDAEGDAKSNCEKIRATTAFVCLLLIAQVLAIICNGVPVFSCLFEKCASLLSRFEGKRIVLVSAILHGVAVLFAFLGLCIAGSFEKSLPGPGDHSYDNGAGLIVTIFSLLASFMATCGMVFAWWSRPEDDARAPKASETAKAGEV